MISGNLLWILLGTMLLGLAAGVIGTFSFLQKQSLIGDAVIGLVLSVKKPVTLKRMSLLKRLTIFSVRFCSNLGIEQ